MWRRVCALLVVAGCWSDDPLIDGALTAPQLAALRADMHRAPIDPCELPNGYLDAMHCDLAASAGQQLFFEPKLSSYTGSNGQIVDGTVACVTCHDPNGYFIDTRTPNNVSQKAVGFTKRNAPTVVDVAMKYVARTSPLVFGWVGQKESPGAILHGALTNAMDVTDADAVATVRRNAHYLAALDQAFPGAATASDDVVFLDLQKAFDAYMFRLNTTSPFDRYMDGDDGALDDDAKRGFGVFVGRGGCVECHRGPALTDNKLHVTGVPEEITGSNDDLGREETSMHEADRGLFVTASLRNVAKTRPYMHDGVLAGLDEVIAFYRKGGETLGFYGTKDPRMVPLELTDNDAHDLGAFLDALTGSDVPIELRQDIRPGPMSCGNTQINAMNCGSCGHMCMPTQACEGGMCIDANACPLPLAPCATGCEDLANDPANCGMCGHTCATFCMGGVCGS